MLREHADLIGPPVPGFEGCYADTPPGFTMKRALIHIRIGIAHRPQTVALDGNVEAYFPDCQRPAHFATPAPMKREWYLSFHGGTGSDDLNNIHVYSADGKKVRKALDRAFYQMIACALEQHAGNNPRRVSEVTRLLARLA